MNFIKRVPFLLLVTVFCCKKNSQPLPPLTQDFSTNISSKLQPTPGIPFITPGESYDRMFVQEPTIIYEGFNKATKIYYTAGESDSTIRICLAISSDMNSVKKQGPVIGKGFGGAPKNRSAMGACIIRANSFYYCFATNGYGSNYPGEDRNVYLYRSADGINFTDLGKILDTAYIQHAEGFGNTAVWPELVNGKYEMVVEALVDSIWRMYHFNSTNIEKGWTYQNDLKSLQAVNGGMYGGACIKYYRGIWHIFYHYCPGIGLLPTIIGYSSSTDLVNCIKREMPIKSIDPSLFPLSDQVADPWIEEVNNKTYMLAEYCTNFPSFKAVIYKWEFNGSLDQLLQRK